MAHKEGPKVSRRFRRPIRRHIKRLNRPRCRFALATRTSGRLINSCSVTLQCARLCGCLWRTPRFFRVVRRHTSLNMRPRWFRYLIRPSNIRYFDGLICLGLDGLKDHVIFLPSFTQKWKLGTKRGGLHFEQVCKGTSIHSELRPELKYIKHATRCYLGGKPPLARDAYPHLLPNVDNQWVHPPLSCLIRCLIRRLH